MLRQAQGQLSQLKDLSAQNKQMLKLYNDRVNTLYGAMQGSVPSQDAMNVIKDQNYQIVQAFGGNALEAIQQGFIDANSAKYSGLIQEREGQTYNVGQEELAKLRGMESQDFVDPQLKAEQENQRRQLLQNLQRQGVTPAGQQAALAQFDQQASGALFNRSQELKNQSLARAQGRIEIGQTLLGGSTSALGQAANIDLQGSQNRFNQAMQGFNASQGYMADYQNTLGNLAALGQSQFIAGQQGTNAALQLQQAQQGVFSNIGQYKLSKDAQNALEMGVKGLSPGSYYRQTGLHNTTDRQLWENQYGIGGNPVTGVFGAPSSQPTFYNQPNQNVASNKRVFQQG